MTRTQDQARELSRRARDDLIRYGVVSASQPIRQAQGQQASAGDLVTARRNSRAIQADHPDRELANRDVLQIISTTAGPGGTRVEVSRLTGRDPATGQISWSVPFPGPRRYLAIDATLAYATTQHAALGRTVETAHALVDGLGDRQGLYVAMSRGRQANYAYCVTDYPGQPTSAQAAAPPPNSSAPGAWTKNTPDCQQPKQPRTTGQHRPGTRCPFWQGSWPATAASYRRPKPCNTNCPAPTAWPSSDRSGTTFAAST